MSQHSSLKNSAGDKKHRNVLKRYERVRMLTTTDKWNNRETVYKLPKVKLIKLKVKKVKEKTEEAGAAGAAGGTTAAPAPAAGKKA